MCVIVYKPKKVNITKRVLKNCWQANPDSTGFMFAHSNILNIVKGFVSFRSFYKSFRQYERQYNENFVLHFRIATHGKVIKENCHPFFVNKNIGFAHNGIFDCVELPKNTTKSDTKIFCEIILQKLPANFLERQEYQILLNGIAKQQSSKLIFLTNKGTCHIFNESAGLWSGGCWYSNTTFKNVDTFGFYDRKYFTKKDYTKLPPVDFFGGGYAECVWCGDYFPISDDYQGDEPICELCIKELKTSTLKIKAVY